MRLGAIRLVSVPTRRLVELKKKKKKKRSFTDPPHTKSHTH